MRKPIVIGRNSRNGFVLIDGLIAIVVFSIGILGMVSLQSAAVKLSTDAKYRTDAAMYADQIVAQMWGADPTTLAANFDSTLGGTGYANWAAIVENPLTGLPGVTATANPPTIKVDSTTSTNLVTVTVYWSAPNDSNVHSYVSVTQIAP